MIFHKITNMGVLKIYKFNSFQNNLHKVSITLQIYIKIAHISLIEQKILLISRSSAQSQYKMDVKMS